MDRFSIVVDSSSTDDTAEVIRQTLADSTPDSVAIHSRPFHEHGFGPARNEALALASPLCAFRLMLSGGETLVNGEVLKIFVDNVLNQGASICQVPPSNVGLTRSSSDASEKLPSFCGGAFNAEINFGGHFTYQSPRILPGSFLADDPRFVLPPTIVSFRSLHGVAFLQ